MAALNFSDPEAEPEVYRSEEQNLWLGVLLAAIADAFFRSDFQLLTTDKETSPEVQRGDAQRFLTMSWGPWAESRETICAAAGVDAELVARACRTRLKLWKQGQRTAEVIELDAAFSRLLDDADDMDPAELDAALAALAELERAA